MINELDTDVLTEPEEPETEVMENPKMMKKLAANATHCQSGPTALTAQQMGIQSWHGAARNFAR